MSSIEGERRCESRCPLCGGAVLHAQEDYPPNPMDDGGVKLYWACERCHWTAKDTHVHPILGQAPAEPPVPKREALGWWHNDRQREPSVYSALSALVARAGEPLTHELAREWLATRWQLERLYSREAWIRSKVGSGGPRQRPDNERRFLHAFSALPRAVIEGRKGGRQHRLSDGRSAADVWLGVGHERSASQRVVRILTVLVSHQWITLAPAVVAQMSVVERHGVRSETPAAAECPDAETFLERYAAVFLETLVREPHPDDCAALVCLWLLAQPEVVDLLLTDAELAALLRAL